MAWENLHSYAQIVSYLQKHLCYKSKIRSVVNYFIFISEFLQF